MCSNADRRPHTSGLDRDWVVEERLVGAVQACVCGEAVVGGEEACIGLRAVATAQAGAASSMTCASLRVMKPMMAKHTRRGGSSGCSISAAAPEPNSPPSAGLWRQRGWLEVEGSHFLGHRGGGQPAVRVPVAAVWSDGSRVYPLFILRVALVGLNIVQRVSFSRDVSL